MRIKSGGLDGLHNIFHNLSSLYFWKEGVKTPPLHVELSPTDICNQNCFYCYAKDRRDNGITLSEDLLNKVIKELARNGVKCCEFQGGGEPLINKYVPNAIELGRKLGMHICLVTNGVLLTYDILEKIEPCLSYMRISSVAHNEEFYSRLHCSDKTHFYTVMHNLKDAVKIRDRDNLNIIIVTTYIIFDFNIKYMVETAKMLKDIGVNIFVIKPFVTLDHTFIANPFHKLYEDKFSETKSLENDNFRVYLNSHQLDLFLSGSLVKNYNKCYGVEFEVYIDENGKVYPCSFYRQKEKYCLGDLTKETFDSIWFSDRRDKILSKFYSEINLKECSKFCCKQHSINEILYDIKNPPLHFGVL